MMMQVNRKNFIIVVLLCIAACSLFFHSIPSALADERNGSAGGGAPAEGESAGCGYNVNNGIVSAKSGDVAVIINGLTEVCYYLKDKDNFCGRGTNYVIDSYNGCNRNSSDGGNDLVIDKLPNGISGLKPLAGGASWHVYSVDGDGPDTGPNAALQESAQARDELRNAKNMCASSRWFIAYAWDGNPYRKKSPLGSFYASSYGTQLDSGPIKWESSYNYKGSGQTIQYNPDGLSYDNIASFRQALGNQIKDGQRITLETAEMLYKEYSNSNDPIPGDVGWFCPGAVTDTNKGQSSANASGKTSSTGFVSQDKTADRLVIENCPSTIGCKASFEHKLIGTNGTKVDWHISRTSNYEDAVSTNDNLKSGTTGMNGSEQQVYSSGDLTLYPGQVVCESLHFKTQESGTQEVTTTACVSAAGNAQPPSDPVLPDAPLNLDGTAIIRIGVANKRIDSRYFEKVYAQPGDKVDFKMRYYPRLQYTYNLVPEVGISISQNDSSVIGLCRNSSLTNMGSLFNSCKPRDWRDWFNGFRYYNDSFAKLYTGSNGIFSREAGASGAEIKQLPEYSIDTEDVGSVLEQYAVLNDWGNPDSTNARTVPTQIKFTDDGSGNIGEVQVDDKKETASVVVPYNFENSIELSADNEIYAGEESKVGYTVIVGARDNDVVKAKYATIVPDAKIKLKMYTDCPSEQNCRDNGTVVAEKVRDLNTGGNLDGYEDSDPGIAVSIPDVDAGTLICFEASVSPKSSGYDTNVNTDDFEGVAYSNMACMRVAKKPSVQIWGGEVKIGEKAETKTAVKRCVYDNVMSQDTCMEPIFSGSSFVFGSWAELGVRSDGEINGLASGASLGYFMIDSSSSGALPYHNRNNNDERDNIWTGGTFGGANTYGFGGMKVSNNNYNMCYSSPLTFGNVDCIGWPINGSSTISDSSEFDVELALDESKLEKYMSLDDFPGTCTSGICYIESSGDVTIDKNLLYSEDEDGYTGLDEVPKTIIKAKNINISCSVTEIDALLIASGTVNTCSDARGGDNTDNDPRRSTQLMIFGAVMAGELKLGRTYGAAAGANSIVPAEIINFDPSLYLMNLSQSSGKTELTDLTTVEITELAPRY